MRRVVLVLVLAAAAPWAAPAGAQEPPPPPPPPPTARPDTGAVTRPDTTLLYDCTARCPESVRPPRFESLPYLQFSPSVIGRSRNRSFRLVDVVIGPGGVIEVESMRFAGGTAVGVEGELRTALPQARFTPATAAGVPVRARVMLRFEFEAEGLDRVRHTYRVVAR